MANNYSETSFMLPCTEAQAKMAVWCLSLLDCASEDNEQEIIDIVNGDRDSLEYMWQRMVHDLQGCTTDDDGTIEEQIRDGHLCFGFQVEACSDGLWFYSEEWFNSDGADCMIQAVLNAFDLDIIVCYAVADTCSKRRVDEFGGYAVAVTKDDVQHISTWRWMQDQKEKFKEGTFAA